jgi:hypothetical protein
MTIVIDQITTSWVSTQLVLVTNCAIQSEALSKITSTIDDYLPLTVMVFNQRIEGNSTILNQLVVGLIIVRAMTSMTKQSLPLRV